MVDIEKSETILLSNAECYLAAQVGASRHIKAMPYTKQDGNKRGLGWDEDINGAGGELAVAKYFNIYWPGFDNDGKGCDIADFQIKTTHLHAGKLVVRNTENDNDRCILVIGSMPQYYIVGWITAKNARNTKYLYNPQNSDNTNKSAYFVPQADLLDMWEFIWNWV